MRKMFLVLLAATVLSGCAPYRFQHGKKPYDQGYVVSRDDYPIVEYTVGKDNSVPDLKTARGRFERRRKTVEHYYKKMGSIENNFKMAFLDPPFLFVKMISGVFRLPCAAVSDYRYEHNPAYRERIVKRQQAEDAKEEERIQKLKTELNSYIQQDIAREDVSGR